MLTMTQVNLAVTTAEKCVNTERCSENAQIKLKFYFQFKFKT